MWKAILATAAAAIMIVSLVGRQGPSDSFDLWKQEFGMDFPSAEDAYRRVIFLTNKRQIDDFNTRGESYEQGVNQFTHLTDEEFAKAYLMPKKEPYQKVNNDKYVGADIDWVIAGKVSTVKNQGACDSGYAFSTTSLLESFSLISKNASILLSEQQLVDCSGSYGTSGCQGGSRLGALNYAKQKGLVYESQYPYKGITQVCKMEGGTTKLNSFLNTTGCDGLAQALKTSPVSIAADASNWKSYRSGIFNSCTEKVTQDALLVGVTTNYWKVKNSWGLGWGEYGYIRLAPGNTCGICGITGYWPQ